MTEKNGIVSSLDKAATTTPEAIVEASRVEGSRVAAGPFVIHSAEGVVLFPATDTVVGTEFLESAD